MNLAPLRELQPTADEIARARRRADEPLPARTRRGPALAAAVVLAAAGVSLATALPGAETATSALRAAAAAAADQPAPAAFTGYRYVDMVDRRRSHWGLPDEECMRKHGEPKPARPGGGRELPNCPVTVRAQYEQEGRQEIWVDSRWRGTRRDHGSRITATGGDPELAAALKRDFGREPSTGEYVYGEGAFVRAPLAELPTDPGALLRTLGAAYEDGRWREGGSLPASAGEPARRFELAWYTAHLLAESNATPALRSAAFGVLARMEGVVDLGRVKDSRGREGHGIEVHGENGPVPRPARVRVIFDPERGEVLAWGTFGADEFVEWTLVRTAHVRERP